MNVLSTVEGPIGILTLNRPEVLNALDAPLMAEATEVMKRFQEDENVRAIVVHGAGRAFSAGFDLKASANRDFKDVATIRRDMTRNLNFIMQFWESPKPTVAVVHGFCFAGAFELALACDVTVAAEGTRLGEPEVRFGAGIVAMLLPWISGPKVAKELLLTGSDRIDAERALALGIVNRVVPQDKALTTGKSIAFDIACASGEAVRHTKRAINRTYEAMGLREALLAGLDIDIELNVHSSPEKDEFDKLRRTEGLKAAIAWRDSRFVRPSGV